MDFSLLLNRRSNQIGTPMYTKISYQLRNVIQCTQTYI